MDGGSWWATVHGTRLSDQAQHSTLPHTPLSLFFIQGFYIALCSVPPFTTSQSSLIKLDFTYTLFILPYCPHLPRQDTF